jgi:branched-chain amino acid transport system ATP-binding protein
MQRVRDLADRVFVLQYGKELAIGAPDDVLRDPRMVQAYIGA